MQINKMLNIKTNEVDDATILVKQYYCSNELLAEMLICFSINYSSKNSNYYLRL